jgi:hypothetical protein
VLIDALMPGAVHNSQQNEDLQLQQRLLLSHPSMLRYVPA